MGEQVAIALIIGTILVSALVNRWRGGGVFPPEMLKLPGHRRLWSALLMATLAALHLDWRTALVFGACWLTWAGLPWGRWYTLGRGDRDWSGEPDWFERLVESFPFPQDDDAPRGSAQRILDDHASLFIRNLIALTPLAILVSWPAAMILLVGMSVAYEIAWRCIPETRGPTGWAEWTTGAIWGVALLASGGAL